MPAAPRLPAPRVLAPNFPDETVNAAVAKAALAKHDGVDITELPRERLHAAVRRVEEAARLVRALRSYRQNRSTAVLAKSVGVSTDTLERLLNGATWPAADIVAVLAEELRIPLRFTREHVDVEFYEDRAELAALRRSAETQAVRDATAEAIVRRVHDDPALAAQVQQLLRSSPLRR